MKIMSNMILPEDLTVEILVRLPVRSLCRFKCVCKSWLSLISDSSFAKSHYDLAARPIYRYLCKSIFGFKVKSIDIEAPLKLGRHNLDRRHLLPHPLSHHQFDKTVYYNILIYGSSRGFLLVDCDHGNLLVWNPTTGLAKPISYQHIHSMHDFLYGFWYDAATDDYLIILMGMYNTRYAKTHIEIFSLKNNSWEQIQGFKFPYWKAAFDAVAGLLLNGALHWLVFSCHTRNHVIIAFDLIQMTLLEIPIPHDIARDLNSKFRLFYLRVLGDCLSLCYPGEHHSYAPAEIWMMKKYNVHSSWTKSFVLPIHYDIRNETYVLPVCPTKSDGFIGSNRHGGLLKYDSKGVLIDHTTFRSAFRIHNIQQSAMYRESLLSLPGDSMEANEDDQQ